MNNENKIRGGDGTKTKEITTIMLTLLLASMLSMAFNVAPAAAASSGGIVGLWHFDTVDMTVSPYTTPDSSGKGNTAYLYPVGSEPSLVDGKFGKALSFDGSDDYVEVQDSDSLKPTSAITVEAWWKAETWGPTSYPPIVKKAGDTTGYGMEAHSDGTVWFGVVVDGAWRIAIYTGPVSLGTWYHTVGVYNGSKVTIYVNGEEGTPTYISGPISHTDNDLHIGHDPANPDRYFDGIIDEVCIWNVALTPKQIEARYTALELKAEINALTADDFKKPKLTEQRKKTLCNKINAVIHQIEAGAYKGAIKKLEKDIRPKLDATKRSWVVAPKPEILEMIDSIISILGS